MRRSLLSIAAAAVAGALLAAPVAQAKEVPLKGISAWPKNFPLTPDFLKFIEFANKAGAGQFKITHIGGPEISKAPAQAKGFKSGLYDLMFTAASYHRGVVPEVDALSATMIRPWGRPQVRRDGRAQHGGDQAPRRDHPVADRDQRLLRALSQPRGPSGARTG